MSEAEKQEGQKTVVAFIAGLLIGGLLVWVFSSSPEAAAPADDTKEETTSTFNTQPSQTAEQTSTQTNTGTTPSTQTNETTTTNTASAPASRQTVTADRDGNISVSDQTAGNSVAITSMTTPANMGWVVVKDEVAGRILGAARFNEEEGLMPTSVGLLRATETGKSYLVTFYADNGDKVFDLGDDAEITGVNTTFTAQ